MEQGHIRTTAVWAAKAFGFTVLAISSLTTFAFFWTYFEIVPPGLLDPMLSQSISGMVGVVLLDAACAIWLYTFLHSTETPEQRAATLSMTVATFAGAAAASVAYLGLSAASAEIGLAGDTRSMVGNMALYTVILAVVANFGATLVYQRFTLQNKLEVSEADKRDTMLALEDEHDRDLTQKIAAKAKEHMARFADALAEEEAKSRVAAYMRRRDGSYAHADLPPLPAFAPVVAMEATAPAPPSLRQEMKTRRRDLFAPISDESPAYLFRDRPRSAPTNAAQLEPQPVVKGYPAAFQFALNEATNGRRITSAQLMDGFGLTREQALQILGEVTTRPH